MRPGNDGGVIRQVNELGTVAISPELRLLHPVLYHAGALDRSLIGAAAWVLLQTLGYAASGPSRRLGKSLRVAAAPHDHSIAPGEDAARLPGGVMDQPNGQLCNKLQLQWRRI